MSWDEVAALAAAAQPKHHARNSTRTKDAPSKQDYETPRDLLDACAERFGPLAVDLACTLENKKAPVALAYPAVDSLTVPWAELFGECVCWLNPPFSRIEPWAAKCREEGERMGRGLILLLTPASVGANWFVDHVHGHALVLPLVPRLTFVGASDPYPKDCMISVFGRNVPIVAPQSELFPSPVILRPGFEPWRWKKVAAAA